MLTKYYVVKMLKNKKGISPNPIYISKYHKNMTIPKYNIHNIHKRLRSDLNNVIDELTMKINPPLSLLERCVFDKKIISIIIKYIVENDVKDFTKDTLPVILMRKDGTHQLKHI